MASENTARRMDDDPQDLPESAEENPDQAQGDADSVGDINLVMSIPVVLSMEIGQTRMTIGELLKLSKGSVVELERLAEEPMDVLVNGTLVARGEAVVVGERFGIRLIDIISPKERLNKLS